MASLTTAPPAVSTTHRKAAAFLRTAICAVLRPWEKRTGPESTFRFVMRQENNSNSFRLLHEENDEEKMPFVLVHFELRDDKVWLMKNETETDFAEALVREGVERDQITP